MNQNDPSAADRARAIRDALPPGGLFAGQSWRISLTPFALGADLAEELETLGRVLYQFYRAVNLLYRRSCDGKAPAWIAELLDQGKPADLIALQRHPGFKNELPRVIRPDVLLTDGGFAISELDSVPGGIGLTQWLGQTYEKSGTVDRGPRDAGGYGAPIPDPKSRIIGGATGMKDGFASLFGDVFDDAATGQGLLNFFLRGIACGAITEAEALATGLTIEEIRSRSFYKILEGRRRK